MRLTVSQARSQLGHLCARAQDPREIIVLTRHGQDLAAIVSIDEVRRIWQLQDEAWSGRRSTVTGRRPDGTLVLPQGMTVGPDGQIITHRQMAHKVQMIQMRRKEERDILSKGGLDPIEGGEIEERMVDKPASKGPRRRHLLWRLFQRMGSGQSTC